MTQPVISLGGLAIALLPVGLVIAIMLVWAVEARSAVIATLRMVLQLLAVGYLLNYLFAADQALLIVAVLTIMLLVAGWIAIRHVKQQRLKSYGNAVLAIAAPGLAILTLVSQLSIGVEPWFEPRFMIPLAGMIFAGGMNAVCLAAERFQSELQAGVGEIDARRTAYRVALIPTINSLLAVGLVSLPGMMTGQILSGVSPLIAVRYQIVVMCMLFGVCGLAAAFYLVLQGRLQRTL